jgi:hypothetical protein
VICVYCGEDAGEHDEHAECVDAALEAAVDDGGEEPPESG